MKPVRVLAAALCGAALSAALPPTGWWPLLFTLAPLFAFTANAERPRQAFLLGFAFALPFFTVYLLWLPASFSAPEFFGSFFWLLYPPLLLILSSFWGAVTYAARRLGGRGARTLILLPPLWVLMEWARTQGYFAFPWGTLGYGWLDTPVAQLADIVGVWGLSLLTAGLAALLAAPFVGSTPRWRDGRTLRSVVPALIALLLLGAAWPAGAARERSFSSVPDRTAVLVQGNLDPFGRLAGMDHETRVQARLTRLALDELEEPPELVVWPEGAVLSGFEGVDGRARLAEVQGSAPESVFLVGARARREEGSFNSAVVISEGRIVDFYDKRYLVPFGERFPLVDSLAPLYRAVFGVFGLPLLESTSPGAALEPLDTPHGRIAAYICYESVFPQVQRAMVARGAQLLVNITNDAWFARGSGARQHYAMGRMRAIETRRFLLRAGLDGITGMVDPTGRNLVELPRGTAATLTVGYSLREGVSPWVRHGGLLVPLLLLWTAAGAVWRAAPVGSRPDMLTE